MRSGDWLQRFVTANESRSFGKVALAAYFWLIVAALLSLTIIPRFPESNGEPRPKMAGGQSDTSLLAGLRAATIGGDAGSAGGRELAFEEKAGSDNPADGAQDTLASRDNDANRTDLPARQAAGHDAGRQGFIPLEFSLPPGAGEAATLDEAPDGGIQIRKLVRRGGTSLGTMRITVDRNSRLYAEAVEVRRLLEGSRVPAGVPETGLVSFRMLRDLGVDLRYSPTEDIVTLRND